MVCFRFQGFQLLCDFGIGIGDRRALTRGVVKHDEVSLQQHKLLENRFIIPGPRPATYFRFSALRELIMTRERGLNADTSKYGECT